MKLKLAILLFFVLATCCHAQSNLASLKSNYEAASSNLDTACEQHRTDALVAYGKALDALLLSLKQKGDIDNYPAVAQEKKRFEAKRTVLIEENQQADVIMAGKKYRQAVDDAEADKNIKLVALLKQYVVQIKGLIQDLMVQSKIEDATAAKEERDKASFMLADAESKLPESVKAPKKQRAAIPPNAREFSGHHYLPVFARVTWHQARAACENMGGHLIIITDGVENNFAGGCAAKRPMWIGLTDEAKEGDWRWVDGSKAIFTSWGRGEPSNSAGIEHFAHLWGAKAFWNDMPDYPNDGYICEWDY